MWTVNTRVSSHIGLNPTGPSREVAGKGGGGGRRGGEGSEGRTEEEGKDRREVRLINKEERKRWRTEIVDSPGWSQRASSALINYSGVCVSEKAD